jgi:glycosyltransferase involved in cell wall biosynthesis
LQKLIDRLDLRARCQLLGFVPEEELVARLANARAIFYAPFSEDYGFTTIEAFLARKPVITCHDSGEVTRFVSETASGWVCEPQSEAISECLKEAFELSPAELEQKAASGCSVAKSITWENVLNQLVIPYV